MKALSHHSGSSFARPALAAVLLLLATTPAVAVDWSAVKEKQITLLYPGQASWEWVMTQSDHSGAAKFREGKTCSGCHEGEQADMGKALLSGTHKAESAPPKGRPGSQTLFVKTAHDAERLYFQLRWKPAAASGVKMSKDAAHITVMLDDGGLKESARAGCWASCHDDAVGMKSAPAGSEITKYHGGSRVKLTRQGGGVNYKPAADLEAALKNNAYFEFWQAVLNPGQPAKPVAGYVLDQRKAHAASKLEAQATFANGEWTVTLSRPLKPAGPGEKTLAAGKDYSVGFALHDDYANHRYHHVSLGNSLRLDSGAADLVAAAAK
jgi:cytochrome c-type protein NapC